MNLFGKIFKLTFLFLILAELFSFFAHLLPPFNSVVFFVILALTLILALIKLEYGFYILLAELFVGSKGYLFALNWGGVSISIRIGLFLVILGVWIYQKIKFQNPNFKTIIYKLKHNKLFITHCLLLIAVFWGLINGLLHNNFGNVFFDFNAWLYFALIFVFWEVIKSEKQIWDILQVLAATVFWLALKTIITLFLFAHNIVLLGDPFYKWIRDSGVGEITYVSGNLFRVFFQSHLYSLIAFFIFLSILVLAKLEIPKRLYRFIPHLGNTSKPPIIRSNSLNGQQLGSISHRKQGVGFIALLILLTSLTIFISFSRSFWIGGLVAFLGLILYLIWQKIKFYKILALIFTVGIMIVFEIGLIYLITGNFTVSLIKERVVSSQYEAAGSSRLQQLKPLWQKILKSPIFGSGFGTEVTYQSQDPRILKTNPGGWYTTYAFEWGYLDIWLKIGLLGLIIYLILIGTIFYQGIKKVTSYKLQVTSYNIINLGLLLGLIALCITNIFSPYLNHPLGIGYIMLVSAIVSIASQTKIKKDAVKT